MSAAPEWEAEAALKAVWADTMRMHAAAARVLEADDPDEVVSATIDAAVAAGVAARSWAIFEALVAEHRALTEAAAGALRGAVAERMRADAVAVLVTDTHRAVLEGEGVAIGARRERLS